MPPSESTPLLSASVAGHDQSLPPFYFLRSYFNILLVFVPLASIAHNLNWGVDLRFAFSLLAIVPLPGLVRGSTKQVSVLLSPKPAILFDTSFGDLVEIIVSVVALLQDDALLIRAFILGSVLANILLVLGCSFLAAGFIRSETKFQATRAQASSSLMTLAVCTGLVIPAAYSSTLKDVSNQSGLLVIYRGTAIVLLAVYFAFLYFQLSFPSQTHSGTEESFSSDRDWVSGRSRIVHASPDSASTPNAIFGAISLSVLGVVTYFCAKYLVISIQEFTTRHNTSKVLIGLILLPLIVNLTKHIASVRVAVEDEMELTIMYCVGSSIRIANFVAPLLIIGSWVSGHAFTLTFANFETVVLFVSVLLVNTLIQDGRSNYMEGLMLVSLYFVILLACSWHVLWVCLGFQQFIRDIGSQSRI